MQSILINIVFALHAQASYSIVKCYYELSKRLGHALVYEESRVGYLSDEMKLMAKIHDEIATTSAENELAFPVQSLSAFDLILEQSSLAQCLKSVLRMCAMKQTKILKRKSSFPTVVDIPWPMHNWPSQHDNQSMGYTVVLSTSQSSSGPQKGNHCRTGKNRSLLTITETVPRYAVAGRSDRTFRLCATVGRKNAFTIDQRIQSAENATKYGKRSRLGHQSCLRTRWSFGVLGKGNDNLSTVRNQCVCRVEYRID